MKKSYTRASIYALLFLLSMITTVGWLAFGKDDITPVTGGGKIQIVFYNKVPKSGSSSLLSVIKYLSRNLSANYTLYQHPGALVYDNMKKRMPKELVRKEAAVVTSLPRPAVYSRHVYFINFTEFGLEKPMYINLVRDPVDRFVSNYFYEKFGNVGQNRSRTEQIVDINECIMKMHPRCSSRYYLSLYLTKFFCGQSVMCGENAGLAIDIAKRNIKSEYVFVGLIEEFESSLLLLERILPAWFAGALKAWRVLEESKRHQFTTVNKHEISAEAHDVLRKEMWADYEIYNFITKRFRRAKAAHSVT